MTVSVGDTLGDVLGDTLTLGLGLALGMVSALLAQAVNKPSPAREITRRIQIFFKAVRLLAAIVCRSKEAYFRQSFPTQPIVGRLAAATL